MGSLDNNNSPFKESKQKQINCGSMPFNIPLVIGLELCRQMERGIIKLSETEKIKTIKEFIENARTKKTT